MLGYNSMSGLRAMDTLGVNRDIYDHFFLLEDLKSQASEVIFFQSNMPTKFIYHL